MNLSESAISRLTFQHRTIAEIISGVPEGRLKINPTTGKWSIHDNIAHLARYNIVFQERIKTILVADFPSFPRYRAEDDPEFIIWQNMKTPELLQSISIEREKILLLSKSISGDALKRVGMHPRFGALTIADWLEFFLLHEAHHIFTIFQLKNDVSLKPPAQ